MSGAATAGRAGGREEEGQTQRRWCSDLSDGRSCEAAARRGGPLSVSGSFWPSSLALSPLLPPLSHVTQARPPRSFNSCRRPTRRAPTRRAFRTLSRQYCREQQSSPIPTSCCSLSDELSSRVSGGSAVSHPHQMSARSAYAPFPSRHTPSHAYRVEPSNARMLCAIRATNVFS